MAIIGGISHFQTYPNGVGVGSLVMAWENSDIFGDGFGVDGIGLDDFLDYAKWGGFDNTV